MTIKGDFTRLEIYQLAEELVVETYRLLPNLPGEERFALGSQLRRAVLSVGANIAEGEGRFYYKDRKRFLYQARGSLYEVKHFLLVGRKLGYFSKEELVSLFGIVEKLGVKINNYMNSLSRIIVKTSIVKNRN